MVVMAVKSAGDRVHRYGKCGGHIATVVSIHVVGLGLFMLAGETKRFYKIDIL